MHTKIFMIPFRAGVGFDASEVDRFCQNKQVLKYEVSFFQQAGQAYWTVLVGYLPLLPQEEIARTKDGIKLSEVQRKLFDQLRAWRKEQADKSGRPPYVVANDRELKEAIVSKAITMEALKKIKGFGKQKQADYGKQIIAIVKQFYEQEDK